jgi:hypothetical protein
VFRRRFELPRKLDSALRLVKGPHLAGKALKPLAIVAIGVASYLLAATVGQGLGMLRFSPRSLQEQAGIGALDRGPEGRGY